MNDQNKGMGNENESKRGRKGGRASGEMGQDQNQTGKSQNGEIGESGMNNPDMNIEDQEGM